MRPKISMFLYDECVSHGLKARHICQNLDFALEMIFVPTDDELVALSVRFTENTKRMTEIKSQLGLRAEAE